MSSNKKTKLKAAALSLVLASALTMGASLLRTYVGIIKTLQEQSQTIRKEKITVEIAAKRAVKEEKKANTQRLIELQKKAEVVDKELAEAEDVSEKVREIEGTLDDLEQSMGDLEWRLKVYYPGLIEEDLADLESLRKRIIKLKELRTEYPYTAKAEADKLLESPPSNLFKVTLEPIEAEERMFQEEIEKARRQIMDISTIDNPQWVEFQNYLHKLLDEMQDSLHQIQAKKKEIQKIIATALVLEQEIKIFLEEG